MTLHGNEPAPDRAERRAAVGFLVLGLLFQAWGLSVGWPSHNLPGLEFRQAQTAISAYHIQRNHDFSLAYPTPVLGKPWSIPMEFPLYQWTTVGVSEATGLDLTKAGRLVSMACFYLCLPAVYLLLAGWAVAPGRRWMVLAVVVTSPFYIFYGRAFLIETMALMFSLWFWVAFERAVGRRHGVWLLVAMLAGCGAGLVKVTTFMLYLCPAGWWALCRVWSGRAGGRWRGDLAWIALALAPPCAATLAWLHFADVTKALNPSAQFIREASLRDFNFGTWAVRLSPETWRQQWRNIADSLSWGPLLAAGAALTLLAGRPRRGDIAKLLLWFGVVLGVFPVLYARHEYYFAASGILLLVALGLVPVALAESRRPRWLVLLVLGSIVGAQAYRYLDGYYGAQQGVTSGGDGLSRSLGGLTAPDDVLVITGQDWNSMTPYYAKRRALMIRADAEQNAAQLDAAFAALAGENIGALVLGPDTKSREELVRRAAAMGIDPQPVYRWREMAVYLPKTRRDSGIRHLLETGYEGLQWEPGVQLPVESLAAVWFETARLRPDQQRLFAEMRPRPVRFFSTFGPNLDGSHGTPRFGAHPTTRLVFHLAAGAHTLRTSACFSPDAYAASLPEDQRTDGVEVTLAALVSGHDARVLFTRVIDPRDHPADRGVQILTATFTLSEPTEVELLVGPGPNGRDTRDWVWLGRVVFD